MKPNENNDESAIVIWVTALEGASFETYRNDPTAGAEIRLPLAPAALADAVMHNPEIDCGVLFEYCDLREIYDPIEYLNVALQYDALPYRKWTSPLDLKEIGMDFLTPHDACDLQLGWELAGKDTERDRNDMSVEELIELGEDEAENRDLVVWRYGYMDPYEGGINTVKYSKEEIVEALFS